METAILTTLTPEELQQIISSAIKAEIATLLKNSTAPTKEEYLSRKQAAKLLGVSLPTLTAWVKDGKVKCHRIGCSVRFKLSEIDRSLTKIKY